MATQIITTNRSTGISVGAGDTVYLGAGATQIIASGTGAAIGSANITAQDSTLLIEGAVVHLGTGAGIRLIGTDTGSASGLGSHDITMTEDASILTRGTCIEAQGSANRYYLDGALTGETALRNTGSNTVVQHTGSMAMAGAGILVIGSSGRVWNTGSIETGKEGISVTGNTASINNAGLVKSANIALDAVGDFGAMVNAGTVLANIGMRLLGDGGAISNSGTITSRADGIFYQNMGAGLFTTNIQNSGQITAGNTGITAIAGNLTVRNADSITARGTGVQIDGTQFVSLMNSGTINAATAAAVRADTIATLHNSGQMLADGDAAVIDGSVMRVVNSGALHGFTGLRALSGTLTLTNRGEITGQDAGVTSAATTTLMNRGEITGGNAGLLIQTRADLDGTSHRLTNTGHIAGDAAISVDLIPGPSTGHVQISNSGTIAGDRFGVIGTNIALTLWNSGQITATGQAITTGFQTRIENHGLIATAEAGDEGTAILLGIAGDVLRNFATISGAVQTDVGNDRVLNRGLIAGDLRLDDGNDSYTGKQGRIEGMIDGGAGNDTITAGDDDDTIRGGEGDDQIFARGGDDTVTGGTGRDIVALGTGADDFILLSAGDSSVAAPDALVDFTRGTDDIDLRALGSGGRFIGDAAFGGVARQVRYTVATGLVQGDVNGDSIADWAITITNRPALTAADFIF